MTTKVIARSACVLLLAGCPLPAPPAPQPIDCEQIDRAQERFPDECGDGSDDGTQLDASDGQLEAGAQ